MPPAYGDAGLFLMTLMTLAPLGRAADGV